MHADHPAPRPLRRLIAAAAALVTALCMAGWLVTVVAIGLLTAPTPAAAAVIAIAQEGTVTVELHDEAGMCLGQARLAVYRTAEVRVPGCWTVDLETRSIRIAWLDGDYSTAPVGLFREPSPA